MWAFNDLTQSFLEGVSVLYSWSASRAGGWCEGLRCPGMWKRGPGTRLSEILTIWRTEDVVLGTKVLYEFYLKVSIFLFSRLAEGNWREGRRSVSLGLVLLEFIVNDLLIVPSHSEFRATATSSPIPRWWAQQKSFNNAFTEFEKQYSWLWNCI